MTCVYLNNYYALDYVKKINAELLNKVKVLTDDYNLNSALCFHALTKKIIFK